MGTNRVLLNVCAFTMAMVLVAAGLVAVFGQFRFSSTTTYHADFTSASKLKAGQKVRIAGVPVGTVRTVKLARDYGADIEFDVDSHFTLYSSARALIRYENLIGDRFIEIIPGTSDLHRLTPGSTIDRDHTEPALDLDSLLGGLRPVLKGLDGAKVNTVTNAVVELLQGQGGALSDVLADTATFTQTLNVQDQVIGDVITNLNTLVRTVDQKNAQFSATIDRLQRLITALANGRDHVAGAIRPLASAETDLTTMLDASRRPMRGVLENVRPLATALDDRKGEVNAAIEPLAENYMRLNALGAYGAFFNIFVCGMQFKINGPAGSDVLIPFFSPPDPSKGRCSFAE
jgi:phospholipid/cholesterol/gamma-HCH transport system substrate-binding protein